MANARPAGEDELAACCEEGRRHLEMMDTRAACQAFERLLEAIDDVEAPGAHEALGRAVAGLADCLDLSRDSEVRRAALHALWRAYLTDARSRANGLTREIPFLMLRGASRSERESISHWVREALGSSGAPGEACWRLLLDLADASPLAVQALLAECQAAGYPGLVAEKLLDMERVGEALNTARRELKDADSLLRFANSPAAHGQARAVMALVAERLHAAFDPRLADWLADRYAERGDLQHALEVRLRLLQAAPGRGDYARVEALARRLGTWEALRPRVARTLRRSRREEALAELALGEGDMASALAYVAKAPGRYSDEIVAHLAGYAAEANPKAAVALYRHLLERALVAGPAAGDEVGEYLNRLHKAYGQCGALNEWRACLQELHDSFGLQVWS